jgi:hypothetical protein
MQGSDPPILTSAERAGVRAALARDPALEDELELIDAVLEPAARARFWPALAQEVGPCRRPAAAVLAALERAAQS